jgi:hypothetical protein
MTIYNMGNIVANHISGKDQIYRTYHECLFGLPRQNIINHITHKHCKFTSHTSRGWEFKIRASCGEALLLAYKLGLPDVSSHGGRKKVTNSLTRLPVSVMRVLPS